MLGVPSGARGGGRRLSHAYGATGSPASRASTRQCSGARQRPHSPCGVGSLTTRGASVRSQLAAKAVSSFCA